MAAEERDGGRLDFGFPFEPYQIQKDFMNSLYDCLRLGKLGIFESPTGTGKSLSLICGALTWLLDEETRVKAALEEQAAGAAAAAKEPSTAGDANEDDWFGAAVREAEKNRRKAEAKKELDSILAREERYRELRQRRQSLNRPQVQKVDLEFEELFKDIQDVREAVLRELGNGLDDDDVDSVPKKDYDSDDEDESVHHDEDDGGDPGGGRLRVYYCSRTHSQLAQFVREVQKTKFGDDVRLVSIGSRANMCINESVRRLGSNSLMNERCLELGKNKGTKAAKLLDEDGPAKKRRSTTTNAACPFNKAEAVSNLRDQTLLQVQDIEQLVTNGRKSKACPYYASRGVVKDAQIVVLPYNTLLHKPTREACGIDLKDSVVIIDEAHNLLDTISHIHSAEVSGQDLEASSQQVGQYLSRYSGRLLAKHLLYLKQVTFILSRLVKVAKGADRLMSTSDFFSEAEVFNLNLVKLIRYMEKSRLAFKASSLMKHLHRAQGDKVEADKARGVAAFLADVAKAKKTARVKVEASPDPLDESARADPTHSAAPLMQVAAFLKSLTGADNEGRIVVSEGRLKYLLLNPAASQFADVVASCRSVVVAGGTMRPISEFRQQLFVEAGADPSRLVTFSCGHVVPGENVLPLVVKAGPTGKVLDFSFNHRDSTATLDELGRALSNVVGAVPGGVVVFFPSYAYEAKVYDHLEASGVLARMAQKKVVFREPKAASEMDKVLKEYARSAAAVRTGGGGGAVLMSVVGGKMSEGINFSDDLGRCVVMVGLPFPNARSPELKEKMDYLNANGPNSEDGRSAGQVHYENLCMKAVNQSIGRAIRHRNDYAAIVLLDHRYSRPNICNLLPDWIRRHLKVEEKFGPLMPRLIHFFKSKRG